MNIDFNNHECMICGKVVKNKKALGMHLSSMHKEYTLQKYVLEKCYNNIVPKCKCGCDEEVNWHKSFFRYNEYKNGHNDSVFKKKEYKETEETKNKRIESIRNSYREKGKEIKEKISKKLVETYSDEKIKDRISKKSLLMWSDVNFRKKVSESQKKSWLMNYEQRCKSIFTKEFRDNLSLLNMKRNKVKKSKKEVIVYKKIKECFIDAKSDYWLKVEDKFKCFDVYIPSLNLLIELDGKYWHGLNRESNFTLEQLNNMKNDLIKNRVTNLGYDLIRINIDDLQDASIFNKVEDLYNLSYFIKSKNLNKMGAFKFKDNMQPLYTRDWLIKQNLKDKKWVETKLLKAVVEYFSEYVKNYGWFYPENSLCIDDVIDLIKDIKFNETNIEFNLKDNKKVNDYLKSIFKSFWNVDGGPVESFKDYNLLYNVVKYRMGINNSKIYSYKVEGQEINTNETFDITPHNIIRGFIVQKHCVSWFKPVTAAEIYKFFLKEKENPIIWDPSMGFGARMLGFCSVYNNGVYYGTDPSSQTYNDLEILKKEIELSKNFKGNINIFKMGSEYFNSIKDKGDLVFTSPPYFDTEKYFDENGQCWKDYSDINEWKEKYLYVTFVNAFNFLKNDGIMCINISQKYKEIFIEIAEKAKFKLVNIYNLNLKTDHFKKKKQIKTNNELILIFNK